MTYKRRKPYTKRGLRRVPCFRCGAPSGQQWQICADGNVYRGVCMECDIALNALVLDFMGFDNRGELIQAYRRKLAGGE